jgi:hypothetical protein
MERFKTTERVTAYEMFLRDFRDGAIGNITLDDPSSFVN